MNYLIWYILFPQTWYFLNDEMLRAALARDFLHSFYIKPAVIIEWIKAAILKVSVKNICCPQNLSGGTVRSKLFSKQYWDIIAFFTLIFSWVYSEVFQGVHYAYYHNKLNQEASYLILSPWKRNQDGGRSLNTLLDQTL